MRLLLTPRPRRTPDAGFRIVNALVPRLRPGKTDRYLGHGAFRYDFTGDVTWTDHGINSGGCLWQGEGVESITKDLAGPGIVLDYLSGSYKGTETLHDRFYTVTATGGGGFPCHATADAPANTTLLSIPKRKLGFDQNALKGQAGSALAESTEWKWSFKS